MRTNLPTEWLSRLRRETRGRAFFIVRVSLLLAVFLLVVAYAFRDISLRAERRQWQRPLRVALVVVAQEPLESGVRQALVERVVDLEALLGAEMRRYRRGSFLPFRFVVVGPISLAVTSPPPPASASFAESARFAWSLRAFTSYVDDAAKINSGAFDSRVYLVARPPKDRKRKAVEGASQQGGWVGVVDVELDNSMVDFALFVATHELFHTLNATDKYDSAGNPLVPEGLAEPAREPLFPQPAIELMARHRATSPTTAVPPERLEELQVGEKSAAEIGWTTFGP